MSLLAAVAIAATAHGFIVAHDQRVDLYDENARFVVWSVNGVAHPTTIITSGDHVAVADSLSNEVTIIDAANHRALTTSTGETPIAGAFLGGDLLLVERDARLVERFGMDGSRASIHTAADPAFITSTGDHTYVYSRGGGELEEISLRPFAMRRVVTVPPFASDLEADDTHSYLVYPRSGMLVSVALDTLTTAQSKAGSIPTDLSIDGTSVAIADPSSKRVWILEGTQSFASAFARGFLRGLLGIGGRKKSDAEFPTGVDRVFARDGHLLAYDSATSSLYSVSKSKSSLIAKDITPLQFAISKRGIFVWDDAVRRLQKIAD